jgi:2-polyprenyl-3-methyl-5-hydroxy-6-metoxy-1,4-benzoquinol methylase
MAENTSLQTKIDYAVASYLADWSWTSAVKSHFRINDDALADLIACFFPDRRRDGLPLILPDWADWPETRPSEYQAKCSEVRKRRGWDADMSVLGALHLEFLAHDHERLMLTRDWLVALGQIAKPGRKLYTLDFGCGASNYSELALNLWPDSHATLADVDPSVMDYLKSRYGSYGDRVKCVALPSDPRLSKRARVDVDHRVLVQRYDAIVMSDVLEHTLDPMVILVHMMKRLNPGGLLFINFPHYIEGDWHTPEAYYMRSWCMRYLRRTCSKQGEYVWFERRSRAFDPKRFALEWLRPLVRRKADRYTREYFKKHGQQLVEQVRSRARREITVEQLLESVG